LDEKHLTLINPILGEMVLDRGRLRRLRWLFHGRRIELDHTRHHLGPEGKLVAGIFPVRAEGLAASWRFDLNALPATAKLHLQVIHLKGHEDGDPRAWERGELRTEVVVNGKVVDYLNHHVQRAGREPHRVTVALPRRALQFGRNILRLRQTPERKTKHYESCSVADLVIEMAR
jgi:hypothetical protein